MKRFLKLAFIALLICSCNKNDTVQIAWPGIYTSQYITTLTGFEEEKDNILSVLSITNDVFISISTSPAWELTQQRQTELKVLRKTLTKPGAATLLQKVIPLEEIPIYIDNIYGGTIGGYVYAAADIKSLQSMSNVYWGLRLDYKGSKFLEHGAGYGVIRFVSSATDMLVIPLCEELGGTEPRNWPNGGGGFTTSTLGEGGYPESKFNDYYAPNEGAELYEVTTNGYQILRAVYSSGAWHGVDIGIPPATILPKSRIENGVSIDTKGDKIYRHTMCRYQGEIFNVRGEIDGIYHITSGIKYPNISLDVIEKGIWGCSVKESALEKIWVEERK